MDHAELSALPFQTNRCVSRNGSTTWVRTADSLQTPVGRSSAGGGRTASADDAPVRDMFVFHDGANHPHPCTAWRAQPPKDNGKNHDKKGSKRGLTGKPMDTRRVESVEWH